MAVGQVNTYRLNTTPSASARRTGINRYRRNPNATANNTRSAGTFNTARRAAAGGGTTTATATNTAVTTPRTGVNVVNTGPGLTLMARAGSAGLPAATFDNPAGIMGIMNRSALSVGDLNSQSTLSLLSSNAPSYTPLLANIPQTSLASLGSLTSSLAESPVTNGNSQLMRLYSNSPLSLSSIMQQGIMQYNLLDGNDEAAALLQTGSSIYRNVGPTTLGASQLFSSLF